MPICSMLAMSDIPFRNRQKSVFCLDGDWRTAVQSALISGLTNWVNRICHGSVPRVPPFSSWTRGLVRAVQPSQWRVHRGYKIPQRQVPTSPTGDVSVTAGFSYTVASAYRNSHDGTSSLDVDTHRERPAVQAPRIPPGRTSPRSCRTESHHRWSVGQGRPCRGPLPKRGFPTMGSKAGWYHE